MAMVRISDHTLFSAYYMHDEMNKRAFRPFEHNSVHTLTISIAISFSLVFCFSEKEKNNNNNKQVEHGQ